MASLSSYAGYLSPSTKSYLYPSIPPSCPTTDSSSSLDHFLPLTPPTLEPDGMGYSQLSIDNNDEFNLLFDTVKKETDSSKETSGSTSPVSVSSSSSETSPHRRVLIQTPEYDDKIINHFWKLLETYEKSGLQGIQEVASDSSELILPSKKIATIWKQILITFSPEKERDISLEESVTSMVDIYPTSQFYEKLFKMYAASGLAAKDSKISPKTIKISGYSTERVMRMFDIVWDRVLNMAKKPRTT